MGMSVGTDARAANGAGTREILVVVGVALTGVLLAMLVALTPWHLPRTFGPVERLPVVVGIVEPFDQGRSG
jgi:hypothetical protein